MNHSLLAVVKRIISERGEGVLADPQQLKPLFSQYAKNEPQPDRMAFGRCIEVGGYNALKRAPNPAARHETKKAVALHMAQKFGMDKALCAAALDTLEAALFAPTPVSDARPAQPTQPTQPTQPKPVAQPSLPVATQPNPPVMPIATGQPTAGTPIQSPKVSARSLSFAVSGLVGAVVAHLIFKIAPAAGHGFLKNAINVALWTAMLGVGISISLLIAQSIYLKKSPAIRSIILTAVLGIGLGAVAGFFANSGYYLTRDISILGVITRPFGWGIAGLGIGYGVSMFVPNFPKARASFAGFLGGTIGGIVFTPTTLLPDALLAIGAVVGVAILGSFIGFTISFIEEALRHAWITVIYGPKETRSMALGDKPVVFGSSSEANVFLPKATFPAVKAIVQIENGQVVMNDRQTGQRQVLQNGQRVDFGTIAFVVGTKHG